MINVNEITEELFGLILSRYQIGLESQMRGGDFREICFIKRNNFEK